MGGDYSTIQKKGDSKDTCSCQGNRRAEKNKIKNPEFLQMAPLFQKGFYKLSDETERNPFWSWGVRAPPQQGGAAHISSV